MISKIIEWFATVTFNCLSPLDWKTSIADTKFIFFDESWLKHRRLDCKGVLQGKLCFSGLEIYEIVSLIFASWRRIQFSESHMFPLASVNASEAHLNGGFSGHWNKCIKIESDTAMENNTMWFLLIEISYLCILLESNPLQPKSLRHIDNV